jgi:hypothetical protein
LNIPKNKNDNQKNNLSKSFLDINLYKKNGIITIDVSDEKNKKNINGDNSKDKICKICPNYYFFKKEVIYPSIFFIFGVGLNIYSLGKINILLHQMIYGSAIICLFRVLKCKEIAKIRPNKVVACIFIILAIIIFIVFQCFFSDYETSQLFLILISLFSSGLICYAKYYNYKTMHRYGINFISNKCIIGGKNENNGEYLIEKFNNSNFSIGINNIDNEENENEEEKNNNSSSEDNDNINNKINNTCKKNYFSYVK